MKCLKVLVMIFLVSHSLSGQTLSLATLIEKSKCRDFNCYNSFITGKKFSLISDSTYPLYRNYTFRGNQPKIFDNRNYYEVSSFFVYKDGKTISVSFQTVLKESYAAMVKDLNSSGFKGTEVSSDHSGNITPTVTSYTGSIKNPGITVLVFVIKRKGAPLDSYNFTVSRTAAN